jgi:hypothetical protein
LAQQKALKQTETPEEKARRLAWLRAYYRDKPRTHPPNAKRVTAT